MQFKEAKRMCKAEMELHGLKDWKFEWSNKLYNAGDCRPFFKRIRLCASYVFLNEKEAVLDTILHEIAHGLNWENNGLNGHGKEWRRIAKLIGATPSTSCEFKKYPQSKMHKEEFKKIKSI